MGWSWAFEKLAWMIGIDDDWVAFYGFLDSGEKHGYRFPPSRRDFYILADWYWPVKSVSAYDCHSILRSRVETFANALRASSRTFFWFSIIIIIIDFITPPFSHAARAADARRWPTASYAHAAPIFPVLHSVNEFLYASVASFSPSWLTSRTVAGSIYFSKQFCLSLFRYDDAGWYIFLMPTVVGHFAGWMMGAALDGSTRPHFRLIGDFRLFIIVTRFNAFHYYFSLHLVHADIIIIDTYCAFIVRSLMDDGQHARSTSLHARRFRALLRALGRAICELHGEPRCFRVIFRAMPPHFRISASRRSYYYIFFRASFPLASGFAEDITFTYRCFHGYIILWHFYF